MSSSLQQQIATGSHSPCRDSESPAPRRSNAPALTGLRSSSDSETESHNMHNVVEADSRLNRFDTYQRPSATRMRSLDGAHPAKGNFELSNTVSVQRNRPKATLQIMPFGAYPMQSISQPEFPSRKKRDGTSAGSQLSRRSESPSAPLSNESAPSAWIAEDVYKNRITLMSLPPELLLMITAILNSKTIQTIRLVCKGLEQVANPYLPIKCYVGLEQTTLNNAIMRSSEKKFRITNIVCSVIPVVPYSTTDEAWEAVNVEYSYQEATDQYNKLIKYGEQLENLVDEKSARIQMLEAFNKMPYLQCLELSLDIRGSSKHPLYSYLPKVKMHPKSNDTLCAEISNWFRMIVSLFRELGKKLVLLEVALGLVALNAECFSKEIWQEFQFLERINLSMNCGIEWRNNVVSSISLAQNLTALCLNWVSMKKDDYWLKYKWPELTQFGLSYCSVDATLLISFLANHKASIRTLLVEGCCATGGSWADIFRNGKKCLQLKSAWIHGLSDEVDEGSNALVSRTRTSEDDEHLVEIENYLVRNDPDPFENDLIDYEYLSE